MMNSQNTEIVEAENVSSRDAYLSTNIEEQDATFLSTSESFDSINQLEESVDANKLNSIGNAPIMATVRIKFHLSKSSFTYDAVDIIFRISCL